MQKNLSKGWQTFQTISLFVCPGSYYALTIINNKELLPWMKPDWLPFFGVPLLIIFCASCMLGFKGLIGMVSELNGRYKNLMEIERRYKIEQDQKHRDSDDTEQES